MNSTLLQSVPQASQEGWEEEMRRQIKILEEQIVHCDARINAAQKARESFESRLAVFRRQCDHAGRQSAEEALADLGGQDSDYPHCRICGTRLMPQ